MTLFTHLSDKDVFIDVYRNLLAKRLLNDKCESYDTEKLMITLIKMTCGANVTKKCEGMLTDLNLANNEMKKFEDFLAQKEAMPFEFNVQVLTQAFWPSYKKYEVQIPPHIQSSMNIFENFYKDQQSSHHKMLAWSFANGTATIAASFGNGKQFDFIVSSLQMSILLLFNDHEQLGYKDIKQAMKFEDDVCKKNLFSLMHKNSRILVRAENQDQKSISEADVFVVNQDFSSQLKRIQVPVPVIETAYQKNKVEQDRSHAIEAAIVRIMKNKKQCEHLVLIEEVRAQLQNFQPTSVTIKNKIENLIEREFLQRDEKDRQIYRYLA